MFKIRVFLEPNTTVASSSELQKDINDFMSKYGDVKHTTIKEVSEKEIVRMNKEPKVKKEKIAKEPKIKKEKIIKPLSKTAQVAKKKKRYSTVSDSPIEIGMDR